MSIQDTAKCFRRLVISRKRRVRVTRGRGGPGKKTRYVGNFMGASNIVCIESSNANHRRHYPPASPPKPPLTHACSTDFGLVSSRKFEVNTIIIKLYFVDVGHRICSDFQARFSIPINGSKTIYKQSSQGIIIN